jgi:hypothetical protein
MSSISWTSTTSGNWNTAANWSGGKVPGAADDVTINTGNSITVTYSSGTEKILSLYTGSDDTLDITGGSLAVDGDATLYGAVTQSAGTFTLAGKSYANYGGLTQTGGTIKVASGTLMLDSTASSIDGTISGATLDLAGGTVTIGAKALLSVAQLELTGADVTLSGNLTEKGLYEQSGGTLAIGSNTLDLSGTAGLSSGIISGSGIVDLGGIAEFGGAAFEGSERVDNTGTINQDAIVYIGYNGTDSVSFTNASSGTWNIGGDLTVYGNANTEVTNLGTLAKTLGDGTSSFEDSIDSSGTVTIDSGTLQFSGPTDVFGGTVEGAGTLALDAGSALLSSGVTLSVANLLLDGAAAALGGSLAYDGAYSQTYGTMSLGGFSLTLGGVTSLDGGTITGNGKLLLTGTTEFSGAVIGGSVAATNSGTVVQSGSSYIGYNGTDTVKFTNAAGALYKLEGDVSAYASTGSSFTNAGTFEKTAAAASDFNVSFTSSGTVAIDAGLLTLQGATSNFGGTVSGGGTLALNGAADSFVSGLKLSVGTVLLESGVLTLATKVSYTGSYEQTSGTLTLGKYGLYLTGATSLDNGVVSGSGTLQVAGATVYSYAVEGSAKLINTGTLTITDYIYDGYNSGDTSNIDNAKTTASIVLSDDAYIYDGNSGATLTNAGLLDKASGAGTSVVQPSVTSTGKIDVAAGTLRLSGATNSISGSIIGAGTLELNAGSDTLAKSLVVTVGSLLFDGATVNLGGALTYAGSLQQSGGTLALSGNDLTLSGPFNFTGGYISGTGTIATSGVTTVTGGALSGSMVLQNSGTLVQSGSWYVGYNSGDTAELENLAGGTLRIENNTTLYGQGADAVNNAGTIVKTGGAAAQIDASLTNTGSVTISAGQLNIDGTTNTLGGDFAGAGTLDLYEGTDAISGGTTLGVAALTIYDAAVTLGGAETYAGNYAQTGGTLALGGHVLTLSGDATLGGGTTNTSGTLALSGQTSILNGWAAEGSVVLANSGTITSASYWYLGYNSTDTASLKNAAGATLLLGTGEIYGQSGDNIVNAGTIAKTLGGAGAGYIETALTNTGTISVTQGTLSFLGVVSGDGKFVAGSGTELSFGLAASGGTVTLDSLSDLAVNASAGFADKVAGFAAGDVIELNDFSYTGTSTTFSFDAAKDQLAVNNGSSSFTLNLSGSYTSSSFALFNDDGIVGISHT